MIRHVQISNSGVDHVKGGRQEEGGGWQIVDGSFANDLIFSMWEWEAGGNFAILVTRILFICFSFFVFRIRLVYKCISFSFKNASRPYPDKNLLTKKRKKKILCADSEFQIAVIGQEKRGNMFSSLMVGHCLVWHDLIGQHLTPILLNYHGVPYIFKVVVFIPELLLPRPGIFIAGC